MVRDQDLVSRHQDRKHHEGDRGLPGRDQNGAHAIVQDRQLRFQCAGRRGSVQPIGIAVEAAMLRAMKLAPSG